MKYLQIFLLTEPAILYQPKYFLGQMIFFSHYEQFYSYLFWFGGTTAV